MWYLVAIIVVILLILVSAKWNTSTFENYLYGFWLAEDDDFCAESGIKGMMLFIGEPTGRLSTSRVCYLVITDGLCNQSLTMDYWSSWAGIGIGKYTISPSLTFDDENVWPEKVDITVDMCSGLLRIYAGDTLYAKLVKQHDITNVAKQLAAAKLIEGSLLDRQRQIEVEN